MNNNIRATQISSSVTIFFCSLSFFLFLSLAVFLSLSLSFSLSLTLFSNVKVLCLSPTRELAVQIQKVVLALGDYMNVQEKLPRQR